MSTPPLLVFKSLFLSEISQIKLFNAYKKISHPTGCYYISYILEDSQNKLRVGFTTNPDWGAEYLDCHIESCHLWNEVQTFFGDSDAYSLILPWATVPAKTSAQKDISLRREDYYISSDGISFCKKKGHYREYFAFAPEVNQQNFLSHVGKNLDLIKDEIILFRKESFELIHRHQGMAAIMSELEQQFETNIDVLVNHLNYGNHLGYDSLLSILQEARLRWLKIINPAFSESKIEKTTGWLIRKLNVSYQAEALHGDSLLVKLNSQNISRTKFDFNYVVTNRTQKNIVSYATTTQVCYDFNSSRVARIPSSLIPSLKSILLGLRPS